MKEYGCKHCKRRLPASEFHKNSSTARGLQYKCKDCTKRYTRKDRSAQKNRNLRARFGLTLDEYNNLLDEQGYVCAICTIDIDDVPKEFAVDHDHVTGKVRGLLCSNCNAGLGQFKDSIVFLQKAIEYLQKNGEL